MQNNAPNGVIILFWLLPVIGLILAIVGSVLGYQRKIVVYDGRTDLHVTIASIVSLVGPIVAFRLRTEEPWLFWLLVSLFLVLPFDSIRRSYRANQTVGKTILSVFAKYALLFLITFCALIAVGGALAAVEEVKKKRYGQAAQQAATAAAGAAGLIALRRLINHLVTEQSAKS